MTVVDTRRGVEEQPDTAFVTQHDVVWVVEERRAVEDGVTGRYSGKDIWMVRNMVEEVDVTQLSSP